MKFFLQVVRDGNVSHTDLVISVRTSMFPSLDPQLRNHGQNPRFQGAMLTLTVGQVMKPTPPPQHRGVTSKHRTHSRHLTEAWKVNTPHRHSIQPTGGICFPSFKNIRKSEGLQDKSWTTWFWKLCLGSEPCCVFVSDKRTETPASGKVHNPHWKWKVVQRRSATDCERHGERRKDESLGERKSPRRSFSGPHVRMPSLPRRAGPRGCLTGCGSAVTAAREWPGCP